MKRITALWIAAWFFGIGFSRAVLAEEPNGGTDTTQNMQDRALAEALFRDGKELGEAGHIHEACLKFQESQRLDPALGTLIHLATCYELEGKTASAWGAFQTAAERADLAGEAERAEFSRTRAADLEKRLSRLVISAKLLPAGASVSLDGSELGIAAESTPLPVDPGPHELVVKAPGKQPWSHSFQIEAGPSSLSVEVPALEDAVRPASTEPAPLRLETKSAPHVATNRKRLAGFIAGGVGIAALVVGSVFGIRAASQNADADSHCRGSVCTQQGLDGHAAANTSAWIANIGVGLGVVGLGGGTYLVLTSSSGAQPERTAPSNAALGVQFSARGTW